MATVTKPMALDETLQSTNTALGLLGKDASLQAIVTALATIGLNTVGNLAQLTTEQKTSLVAAINELNAGKIDTAEIGVANGIAELDANGKVLSSQLPSFVDDVVEGYYKSDVDRFYEESTYVHVITPESGKSWVDIPSNKSYRWTGSVYVRVDEGVQLGETSDTAYRGDRGKTAYLHATDSARVTTATAEGLYKVGVTSEGHVSSATAVQKSDITALGIPAQDTTYNDATQSVHGLMSTADKIKLDGVSSNAKKVEASNTNGNIKIDDVETQVYDDSAVQSAIYDLEDDVDAIEGELTTDTATVQGNPINFTTKSAQNAKSTILSLEPIQDLHGYDKPWVGGAGKNLLSASFELGSLNSSGQPISNNNHMRSDDYIEITPSTTYTYSQETVSSEIWVHFYDSNKQFISREYLVGNQKKVTFTTLSTSKYLKFRCNLATESVLIGENQLEEGSTATTYEPYENICPISGRSEIGILGCGKNLFNPSEPTYTNTALDTNGNFVPLTNWACYLFKGGKQYAFSYVKPSGYDTVRYGYKVNGVWTRTNSSTIPLIIDATNYDEICFSLDRTSGYELINAQLEIGNQSSFYKPYIESTSLQIQLGQTVYGGQLDVENGVLVVDRGMVDLSDYTFEVFAGTTIVKTSSIPNIKYVPNNTVLGNGLSENYQMHTGSGMTNAIGCIAIDTNAVSVNAGVYPYQPTGKFVYELATPITINLTPHTINLLKGVNNISTDGDKITLTYRDGSVATLADLLDLEKKLTDEEPYGFIEHMSILDPAQRIEYIGKNKNYSPMTINLAGDHLANYNEWYDFPVIKENKPYMIKSDGTVDYALDPNDYTKKFDGSASDVADTTYTGGAFAWIPKTYKREFVVGNDRYVYISTKKLSDEYEAIGFIDENGLEHDGAWIPMFYGTEITQDGIVKIMTLATGAPTQNRNTDTQKTYLTNANPDTLFFGGAIVKVLTDIMIMLGKNSDIQAVFGTGNMNGGNGAQYMKNNACINGGAFYGTTVNNVLNKAFHSLVLLTQNQYQRDPYTILVNGVLKVSPYYKYDITGATYQDTGITYTATSSAFEYPHKTISVPHWGAVPDLGPYSGSTTTGLADGFYKNITSTRVARRFAFCRDGRFGGPRCLNLTDAASDASWFIGASALLLSKGKSK